MSEEERQREMDFILHTLAEVTTKLGVLTDAQVRTEGTIGELAGQVQIIARQQSHINEVVAVIAESQQQLAESQQQLAESQQHTDERLNALIDIVQEKRNGNS